MERLILDHAADIFIHAWVLAGAVFFSILFYLAYYCYFRDFYKKTVKEPISIKKSDLNESVQDIPSGTIEYESFEGYQWASTIYSARRSMQDADRIIGNNNTGSTYGSTAAETATKSQYKKVIMLNFGGGSD